MITACLLNVFRLLGFAATLLLATLVSANIQESLYFTLSPDDQLRPESIPNNAFTTFRHPSMPSNSLRIKRHTDFCDPTVRSYTGYLDAAYGTQHIFFYYFESRNDPSSDPVVMWFNGGPGCSSTTGLFMENGPCRMNEHGNATMFNKYGWNDRANILFIDQPVNVGFSYSDHSIEILTTRDAARTIQDFVRLFFETFSSLKGRPLHLTGESYAGHYLPVFGSAILDGNDRNSSSVPINLVSVAIGNGMVSMPKILPSWYKMMCTPASVAPILNIEHCVDLKHKIRMCQRRIQADCEDKFEPLSCAASGEYCLLLLTESLAKAERNPYDLSKYCDLSGGDTACYQERGPINHYLNLPATREMLGISPDFGEFTGCNHHVNAGFVEHGDFLISTQFHLEQLIERGVRVLLYDGVLDLYCNKIGYLEMADALEWLGQAEFAATPLKPWFADPASFTGTSRAAGSGKTVRRKNAVGVENVLSWVEIDGAGHMAPFDKPLESLVMINKWLADEGL